MRIIGMLNWFDESESWLSTVVAGMGQFCDAVVALDSGYALYPGARPRSMPEQAEAIMRTAEAVDLECIICRPNDIAWGNEVEKRNKLLRMAGVIAEPNVDWVVVFDADMHLMKCNKDSLRWDLENTKRNVATMTVLEGQDMLDEETLADIVRSTDLDYEWTTRARLVYRFSKTLAYGPAHWTVSRQVKGQPSWLWGPTDFGLEDCLDLDASLVCYHRSTKRALLRRRAAEMYYEARDIRGIESRDHIVRQATS